MQQAQGLPIHQDSPKSKFSLPLVLASVVAIIGLFTASPYPILLILGLMGMAFSWCTTPRQYLIYQNALVIMYGKPRVKAIPLSDISLSEKVTVTNGEMVRVRLVTGRQIMIGVANVEEFQARLKEALEDLGRADADPTLIDEGPDIAQGPGISQGPVIPQSPESSRATDIPQGPEGPAPY